MTTLAISIDCLHGVRQRAVLYEQYPGQEGDKHANEHMLIEANREPYQ